MTASQKARLPGDGAKSDAGPVNELEAAVAELRTFDTFIDTEASSRLKNDVYKLSVWIEQGVAVYGSNENLQTIKEIADQAARDAADSMAVELDLPGDAADADTTVAQTFDAIATLMERISHIAGQAMAHNDTDHSVSSQSSQSAKSADQNGSDANSDMPTDPFPTAVAKFKTLAERTGIAVPDGFYDRAQALASGQPDKNARAAFKQDTKEVMKWIAKARREEGGDYEKMHLLLDAMSCLTNSPYMDCDTAYGQLVPAIGNDLKATQELSKKIGFDYDFGRLENAILKLRSSLDENDWDISQVDYGDYEEIMMAAMAAKSAAKKANSQQSPDADYTELANKLDSIHQGISICAQLDWAAGIAAATEVDD